MYTVAHRLGRIAALALYSNLESLVCPLSYLVVVMLCALIALLSQGFTDRALICKNYIAQLLWLKEGTSFGLWHYKLVSMHVILLFLSPFATWYYGTDLVVTSLGM